LTPPALADAPGVGPGAMPAGLIKNSAFNITGQVLPLVVGLITIPRLVLGLGLDRYGLLAIAWQMIGSLGLFDLGVGRAMTKFVADTMHGARPAAKLAELVWTGLLLATMVGLALGAGFAGLAHPLAYSWLRVPPSLRIETLGALYVLAATLPFVIVNSALLGILEGRMQFRMSSASRLLQGLILYAGPLGVLPFSHSIAVVMSVMLVGRAANCGLLLLYVTARMSGSRKPVVARSLAAEILRFGSWITISNTLAPAMFYLDRILLAALISIAAVAYYAVPYDIVLRIVILPAAVVGVLFPTLVGAMAVDKARARRLFDRATRYAFVFLFPIALVLVCFGPEILAVWVSRAFATRAGVVLELLGTVALFNGLIMIPQAALQAAARPDITAKAHMVQAPVYLVIFVAATAAFGIPGAAAVAAARSVTLCLVFFLLAEQHGLVDRAWLAKALSLGVVAVFVLSLPLLIKPPAIVLLGALGFIGVLFSVASWRYAIDVADRQMLRTIALRTLGLNR
jgi:O-antigen/teichoic acid export membrane protein